MDFETDHASAERRERNAAMRLCEDDPTDWGDLLTGADFPPPDLEELPVDHDHDNPAPRGTHQRTDHEHA
jgi:hypothetical protein